MIIQGIYVGVFWNTLVQTESVRVCVIISMENTIISEINNNEGVIYIY